jgi:hypothetical protein
MSARVLSASSGNVRISLTRPLVNPKLPAPINAILGIAKDSFTDEATNLGLAAFAGVSCPAVGTSSDRVFVEAKW